MSIELQLSVIEQNELERCEVVIKQGLETFIEVGTALMTIRDKRLYRANHATFEDYCRGAWGMSRIHAHRLIEASEVIGHLLPTGNIPASERQARPLAGLEPEVQRAAWADVVEAHGANVTAAKVQEIVNHWRPANEQVRQAKEEPMFSAPPEEIIDEARGRPLVGLFTGQNEWYTPEKFIESARRVMGSIDIDPASNDEAQLTIKAGKYFTLETNGLTQAWAGNVWLNPPYSGQEIRQFIEKLQAETLNGNITQAVVLTNNNTDTQWFSMLYSLCKCVCFTKGRINFYRGSETSSPTNGQCFFYIGTDVKEFANEFSSHGLIMLPYVNQ